MALFLRAAEVHSRRDTDMGTMKLSDALLIGLAQALAIIPGVSRSGVTITAGLFRGMTRNAAAQFSFLLSAPIVGGAVAKKTIDIAYEDLPPDQALPFAVGIIVSAFMGFICISGLMRYLRTHSTFVFINYRIVLGVIVLALGYLRNIIRLADEKVTVARYTISVREAFQIMFGYASVSSSGHPTSTAASRRTP